MGKLRKILTNFLLAFAFISIGFAMGKHSLRPEKQADKLPGGTGHRVAVYYLHSTFRCVTCNTIEKMTKRLLDNSYGKELADGKILWIEDDFQENDALAKRFEVAASCVVVADMKDSIVTDYKRLNDVWTLMKDSKAFNIYISTAIDGYLKKNRGNS